VSRGAIPAALYIFCPSGANRGTWPASGDHHDRLFKFQCAGRRGLRANSATFTRTSGNRLAGTKRLRCTGDSRDSQSGEIDRLAKPVCPATAAPSGPPGDRSGPLRAITAGAQFGSLRLTTAASWDKRLGQGAAVAPLLGGRPTLGPVPCSSAFWPTGVSVSAAYHANYWWCCSPRGSRRAALRPGHPSSEIGTPTSWVLNGARRLTSTA
jgi:hypothetical protein